MMRRKVAIARNIKVDMLLTLKKGSTKTTSFSLTSIRSILRLSDSTMCASVSLRGHLCP